MPDNPSPPARAPHAVFLSYASQDAVAAQRIAEALGAAGVEVWLDQSELGGGDQWDAKIRQQIGECALFLPVISANTQARREGYFRLEWKLAAQRTHMMSERTAFLLPVVIDATRDADADVPGEFRAVQWTRLPAGETNAAFCARVQMLLSGTGAANRADAGPSLDGAQAAREADGRGRATPLHKPSRPWLVPAIAAVLALAAAGAFFTLRKSPSDPSLSSLLPSPSRPPDTAAQSVAVLPFVNRSGDQEQEYFSDGLTEEIINALARERDLRVPGSASSFSFKGKGTPPAEIARALNVTRLVEGSVRKDGTKVRIAVKLTRAADGFSEELGTYTEELSDIFALQDKVARVVVEKITRRAATNTIAVATRNSAAYDAYLRARAADVGGRSDRTVAETVRLYEVALQLDPGFALPSARLAQIYVEFYVGGFDRSSESAAKARDAVATALRFDPNLPEAHLAQARIRLGIDYDLEEAGRELDIVERLRPGEVEVLAVRARHMSARGQQGAALASAIARAADADPQNATSLGNLASNLSRAGLYAEAENLLDRALAFTPATESYLRDKAINRFAWTGDTAAALAILEATPEDVRDKTTRFFSDRAPWRERQGDFVGAIADYERARTVIKASFSNRSGPRSVAVFSLYQIGRIENALGHAARANQCYDQALAEAEAVARDFSGRGLSSRARGLILARRGQATEALALIAENLRLTEATRDVPSIMIQRVPRAEVRALLGRADDAIAELKSLHDAGHPFGYALRANEEFASLRGDGRFQKLMAEAELRANAQSRPKK